MVDKNFSTPEDDLEITPPDSARFVWGPEDIIIVSETGTKALAPEHQEMLNKYEEYWRDRRD
jgi:hypothetical protein